MKVYEFSVKVFLLKDIHRNNVQEKISKFISGYLSQDSNYLKLHNSKEFKPYSYDSLFPLVVDGYKAEAVYSFRIRTIDEKLGNYLLDGLGNFSNEYFKGLIVKPRVIRMKFIDKIFSLTPIVIKNSFGYWKDNLTLEEYEKRLNENLYKKYKYFTGKDLKEEKFYTSMKFLNEKPIGIPYKDIVLLGDKIEFTVAGDKISQELAYMALAVSIGEGNSFGCGFMGYKYL